MLCLFKACVLLILSSCAAEEPDVDMYSSTAEIEIFVATQGKLLKTLQEYYDSENRTIYLIERYLNESVEEYKMIQNSSKYLENPVNVYHFIKRLSKDLQHVKNTINTNIGFIRDITVKYPSKVDQFGAINGLIRLQDVYQHEASDFARGILKGNFSSPMTATDCYMVSSRAGIVLGSQAKVAWLQEGLRRRSHLCTDCLAETIAVVHRIWKEYYEMGNVNETIKWMRKHMYLNPNDQNAVKYHATILYLQKNPEYLLNLKIRKDQEKKQLSEPIKEEVTRFNLTDEQKKIFVEDYIYKALCRGEQQERDYSLTCYYQTGSHPFLWLARVKTELLHRSPDVILYRDVISDAEIRHLKEISKPMMQRVSVINAKETEKRVAKSAFLLDDMSAVVANISHRLSLITNLSMESAEELHLVNYGVGGYYTPHQDFYGNNIPHDIGADRIATVILYLSDVEQGGATVFTRMNLTVFPEKRAALFWWNLHRSGDPNYASVHAGCPVLRGSKWISIKWFHEEGQELIRPCLTTR